MQLNTVYTLAQFFPTPRRRLGRNDLKLNLCIIGLIGLLSVATCQAEEPINFNRDIRPILANHCFRCHGPDAETREAGLRLDQSDSATSELDSGERAIVPGDLSSSELVIRIRTDDESLRMPPSDLGPPLKTNEIELLERWIRSGARYEKHWSLQPIVRPTPEMSKSATAIDHFIDRQLEVHELKANPVADRSTLVRRVSLAITGLPPSLQEVDAFVNDDSPLAYEQLVDRLLASPKYGERWARVWLDIARYADSAGYAQDPARTIWRYRDWVIDAYNANKTFDQFTVEQIAGDMLEAPSNDQLIATAFHRNTMTNSEGGTDDEEFRNAAVVDRVNTTMQVWMGLTMGCAQCHDHKYDDITQEEYFRVFAILNNTQDADRGDESPWLEELTDKQRAEKTRIEKLLAKFAEVRQTANERTDGKDAEKNKKQLAEKQLEKQLRNIRGTRTPIMRELAADKRRETHIQVRGNFKVKDRKVEAGVPSMLHSLKAEPTRLAFSEWLVSQDNPLTARVVVNRYWELLFGKGLVTTSEDFGIQGELPSHPQLLDYLSAELMRKEWDIKWLIKEIVMSDAYRRSSRVSPEAAQLDGSNQWLSRGPRFRIPAEMIRDQALAIAGLLSSKMNGPSVRPPRPNLGLRAAFGGSTDWQASGGEDRYRRGLYTSWRRTTPYPSMATFDAPSREFCTVRRIRTNTPLQALVTLNDPVYIEAAQALARRLLHEQKGFADRAQHAYRLVVSRQPSKQELRELQQLFNQTIATFKKDPSAAQQMAFEPLGATDKFEVSELAAWTVVSNVLLNLDETLAPR